MSYNISVSIPAHVPGTRNGRVKLTFTSELGSMWQAYQDQTFKLLTTKVFDVSKAPTVQLPNTPVLGFTLHKGWNDSWYLQHSASGVNYALPSRVLPWFLPYAHNLAEVPCQVAAVSVSKAGGHTALREISEVCFLPVPVIDQLGRTPIDPSEEVVRYPVVAQDDAIQLRLDGSNTDKLYIVEVFKHRNHSDAAITIHVKLPESRGWLAVRANLSNWTEHDKDAYPMISVSSLTSEFKRSMRDLLETTEIVERQDQARWDDLYGELFAGSARSPGMDVKMLKERAEMLVAYIAASPDLVLFHIDSTSINATMHRLQSAGSSSKLSLMDSKHYMRFDDMPDDLKKNFALRILSELKSQSYDNYWTSPFRPTVLIDRCNEDLHEGPADVSVWSLAFRPSNETMQLRFVSLTAQLTSRTEGWELMATTAFRPDTMMSKDLPLPALETDLTGDLATAIATICQWLSDNLEGVYFPTVKIRTPQGPRTLIYERRSLREQGLYPNARMLALETKDPASLTITERLGLSLYRLQPGNAY